MHRGLIVAHLLITKILHFAQLLTVDVREHLPPDNSNKACRENMGLNTYKRAQIEFLYRIPVITKPNVVLKP